MSQKYYSEQRFTLTAVKADGQKYEDLFNDVLMLSKTGFRKVKAYGNIGDRKNDGFQPSSGTYYQVFAPENIDKERTITNAVSKLEEDFTKLKDQWDKETPIQQFYFVLNDKQKGSPPPVEQKIAELRNLYPEIGFGTFTLDDLIAEFLTLDLDKQQSIIGFIPSPSSLQTVTTTALIKTIEHLMGCNKIEPKTNEGFDLEEFHDKIKFNYLDLRVSDLLEKAETQTYILDDYFSRNQNKSLKKFIRDSLSYIYETEKEKYGDAITEMNSSIIFYQILDKCATDKGSEAINSSLVLMSFFFTSCDIFEKPDRK